MRDKLIDLITIGIARACVKEANGENVDKAAVIADVLIENNVEVPVPMYFMIHKDGTMDYYPMSERRANNEQR